MQDIRTAQKETSSHSLRLRAGLISGVVAIAANMVLLWAAAKAGMATSHGGLLRLTEILLERMIHFVSSTSRASHAPVLPISTSWFQTAFHLATGLIMALLYALFLEARLPDGAWKRGMIYGSAIWLFNSFIVLPITGEGIFGIHHLRLAGIFSFAIAHMTFFVLLCIIFQKIYRPSSMA